MPRHRLRSIVMLAAALLAAQTPPPSHAWSTQLLPAAADHGDAWVRGLPAHEWIMWQAIQYLKRQGYPLAELFERNFDALALGNQYADHHCDGQSGIPNAGDWTTDIRLGKKITQEVTFAGATEASIDNCADVVEHFPMRPEIGHVEEIWDDVQGDDIFAPASATQDYATALYPVARSFLPGWFQPGVSWQNTQPQLATLQPINLGSYRPTIRILWLDSAETPMGWVRAGAVPRESPIVWPPFVAGPTGIAAPTAPQDLHSAMFYLGWIAHLVGDSSQYYHRQRVSGPFHGAYEGDVDALIQSGAFDTGTKQYPIARQRAALVLALNQAICYFAPAGCAAGVIDLVNGMSDADVYTTAAQYGAAAPQTQCAVPFDYDATATSCTGVVNSFAVYVFTRWLGGPYPTLGQIVEASAGPASRAPCRCTEWGNDSAWLSYLAAEQQVGAYGKSPMPVFAGTAPSHSQLAAFAADNLSRGITATATLFAMYGDEILAHAAGNSLVFDAGFYPAVNGDVAARAGGTSQGLLLADWLAHGLGEGRASSPAFDVGHYAAVTEHPLAAGFDAAAAPRQIATLLALGRSPDGGTAPGFNAAQYRALNPDLGKMTDLQAMQQFASSGLGLDAGRAGSVLFDARAYRARYADVAGLTPRAALAHWMASGLAEGRAGSQAFDPAFYLQANPDVAAAAAGDPVRGLRHFAAYGVRESRLTSPAFDVRFYGAVQRTAIDLSGIALPAGGGREIAHWLRTGVDAGLAGSPAFDPRYYRDNNTDLGLTGDRAALDQWLTTGLRDGRRSSIFYDPIYYLTKYPDLAGLVLRFTVYNPLLKRLVTRYDYTRLTYHWLTTGIAEGRRGSAAFDPVYYRAQNLDVDTACRTQPSPNVCAMAHWIREGRAQGRLGAAP